jgi:hypothetical protein
VARADISMRDLEESAVLGEAAAWALTERVRGTRGEAGRQRQDGHIVQWSGMWRVKGRGVCKKWI